MATFGVLLVSFLLVVLYFLTHSMILKGHSYLMIDDLQKAYTAYQQALYHLPSPKVSLTLQ